MGLSACARQGSQLSKQLAFRSQGVSGGPGRRGELTEVSVGANATRKISETAASQQSSFWVRYGRRAEQVQPIRRLKVHVLYSRGLRWQRLLSA
jgi:hypothetical protein